MFGGCLLGIVELLVFRFNGSSFLRGFCFAQLGFFILCLLMGQVVVLRRIGPRATGDGDTLGALSGQGGGNAADHAGKGDGLGRFGRAVELGAEFTHGRTQCTGPATIAGADAAAGGTGACRAGDGVGKGVTERVEAAVLGLGTYPVSALGAGGIENAGDDFGADAGLKVGAGDGAGDGGAGQAGDEVFTDVGGEAV